MDCARLQINGLNYQAGFTRSMASAGFSYSPRGHLYMYSHTPRLWEGEVFQKRVAQFVKDAVGSLGVLSSHFCDTRESPPAGFVFGWGREGRRRHHKQAISMPLMRHCLGLIRAPSPSPPSREVAHFGKRHLPLGSRSRVSEVSLAAPKSERTPLDSGSKRNQRCGINSAAAWWKDYMGVDQYSWAPNDHGYSPIQYGTYHLFNGFAEWASHVEDLLINPQLYIYTSYHAAFQDLLFKD